MKKLYISIFITLVGLSPAVYFYILDSRKCETFYDLHLLNGCFKKVEVETELLKIISNKNLPNKLSNGFSPLVNAIRLEKHDITHKIINLGADVNERVEFLKGYSDPIFDWVLLQFPDERLVRAFVEKGIDFDARSESSEHNALTISADVEDPKIVKILLDTGARIDSKGFWDGTIVHWSATAKTGTLKMLLEEYDGKRLINTKDVGGNTPILHAVMWKNSENVRLLLEYGADPNIPNGRGITALSYARDNGLSEILRILEEK
ncbi:MAG: ankyrin repeat domain-containing protein [Gammaproteobacteria bacterium]|nr:ankyrin repeat domain-containing protein [Gammaproteobacteria bacterium]